MLEWRCLRHTSERGEICPTATACYQGQEAEIRQERSSVLQAFQKIGSRAGVNNVISSAAQVDQCQEQGGQLIMANVCRRAVFVL